MSREIKFRAWQPESKVMLYGSQYGETNNITTETIVVQDGLPYLLGTRCNGNCWAQHLEDGEAMQYTGLKDNNGKEIYHHDIIRIISTGKIKEIIWNKCCFGVHINERLFAPIYWHEDIEVIGNIYEHPDLLSEGKKGE